MYLLPLKFAFMPGKRIEVNNHPIDFTCKNAQFQTDISSPVNSIYPGSVTPMPIYDDGGGQILLLEKVVHNNGKKCFWFMWYYDNGIPILPMSGVIDADDIAEVIRNISKISF